MANLLDLPEEVLEGSILPFLPWNDLLRCRRVCKAIKDVADDCIRRNPKKVPEIQLTEQTGKNLKAFITIGISTTKLFLNNPTGHHFYDNLDTSTLTKFTSTYGPMITSLRVVQLSVRPCFNEWTFLEGLTSLKTFEAEGYGLGVNPSSDNQRMMMEIFHSFRATTDPRVPLPPQGFVYPQNFKSLEVVKIGHNKQYCIGDSPSRLGVFLKNLPKLDFISFPFCSNEMLENIEDDDDDDDDDDDVPSLHPFMRMVAQVGGYILSKGAEEGLKHLKFFDFLNYHKARGMEIEVTDELHSGQSCDFLYFSTLCTRFGVRLLNVNPAWYFEQPNFPAMRSPTLGHPVVSLVNLHACAVGLDMPNLEKITICQTSRTNVNPMWLFAPSDWPSLKILEISVNSKKAVETEVANQDTALLFEILWKDVVRDQLTELSLTFLEDDEWGIDGVAVPRTEDIVSGCPNLRKLRIENWPGTNKQLTKLWSGLQGLEEVTLEYCKNLGNVAFVGENVKDPVFVRLKNLKKLTLKGLDQMPKITDTLFSLVLAKMKLSHLIIRSDKPLEKITKMGLTALLQGTFAETIEKFPFHGWSLATLSAEDFQEIARRFRSYNML